VSLLRVDPAIEVVGTIKDLLEPWIHGYPFAERWRVDDDLLTRLATLYDLYSVCETDPKIASLVTHAALSSHWAFWCLLSWSFDEQAPMHPGLGRQLTEKPTETIHHGKKR